MKEKIELNENYKFLQMVHRLLTELNTTDDKIYKKNYVGCLNWLSYFYQRDKIIESQQNNKIL